jgi:hypothetical protein
VSAESLLPVLGQRLSGFLPCPWMWAALRTIVSADWKKRRTMRGRELDSVTDKLQTRSGHGLAADADRTWTGRGRGLTTVMVKSRTGHGHYVGHCSDSAWPIRRTLRGRCADIVRLAALSLIRGWCLTKMTGFPIPESREKSRSTERPKTHALMCKYQSTERAF